MDFISIGSITIPIQFILIIASISIGLFVSYLNGVSKGIVDILFNSLLIWVISWKLSYVLFNLSLVISNPLSVLYFFGGGKGMILAQIVSLIYLLIKINKNPQDRDRIVRYYSIAWSNSWAAYFVLHAIFISQNVTYFIIFLLLYIVISWWQWGGFSFSSFLVCTLVYLVIEFLILEKGLVPIIVLTGSILPYFYGAKGNNEGVT